jgi:predicted NUDIX family NTP pyrophosphohydrolase
MKVKQSAGILLYRYVNDELQVLLVHPGGPYHVNKDKGAWSIPKGEFEQGEEALVAAKREFEEELGQKVISDDFMKLQPIVQKSGKTVYAWAAEGEIDTINIKSNVFKMEYPYKSGKWIDVAEVDKAEWFTPEVAREKINPGQVPLIDELENILG